MMNPFELHSKVWRAISRTVSDMRKQAPAARMVGEFAVKHVSNEASKKISSLTHNAEPDSKQNPH